VDPADFYSFDVTNTANGLRLETSTPGDGAGPFSNTLDPHIDLFDPSGTWLPPALPWPMGGTSSSSISRWSPARTASASPPRAGRPASIS